METLPQLDWRGSIEAVHWRVFFAGERWWYQISDHPAGPFGTREIAKACLIGELTELCARVVLNSCPA